MSVNSWGNDEVNKKTVIPGLLGTIGRLSMLMNSCWAPPLHACLAACNSHALLHATLMLLWRMPFCRLLKVDAQSVAIMEWWNKKIRIPSGLPQGDDVCLVSDRFCQHSIGLPSYVKAVPYLTCCTLPSHLQACWCAAWCTVWTYTQLNGACTRHDLPLYMPMGLSSFSL